MKIILTETNIKCKLITTAYGYPVIGGIYCCCVCPHKGISKSHYNYIICNHKDYMPPVPIEGIVPVIL
jgi:hypothetical protein